MGIIEDKINEIKNIELDVEEINNYRYRGLSVQEVLNIFYTKILEIVESSNKSLDLLEWLFEIGLNEEVALKIKELVDNGTIENMLGNLLDNYYQKVIDYFEKIEEVEYSSDDNFISFESIENSVIDNVRVEGNTLVNLCGKAYDGSNGNYKIDFSYDLSEFTILCPIDDVFMNVRNSDGTWDGVLVQVKNGVSYIKMNNGKKVRGFQIANTSTNLNKFKQGCITTLEGDYTENPPSYFEGIKSVGELEELEILNNTDKKKFLYNDNGTWKPIILREWDYIEQLPDGRYKYHKCSGEKVFDGSEDWSISGHSILEGSTGFETYSLNKFMKDFSTIICDKIVPKLVHNVNEEGIWTHNLGGKLRIRMMNTKLTEPTTESFKARLQANPVTVVYQLAQEEVYDCIDLSLESFEGENSVFTNSSIPHKLNVTNIKGYKAKRNKLEQEMKFIFNNFKYESTPKVNHM